MKYYAATKLKLPRVDHKARRIAANIAKLPKLLRLSACYYVRLLWRLIWLSRHHYRRPRAKVSFGPSVCLELTAVVSLLCYFLCWITVVPSLTVAAEGAWGGWHGGGDGWPGGAAPSPYYGCYGHGYSYYAGTATVIRLTGGCGYTRNYSYGYDYRYAYGPYVRPHFYAAVRRIRRVQDHRSAAASSSTETATTRAPSSHSKTVQAAASPRNVWTPMTVPVSRSPVNEPAKTHVNSTEWAKKFELRLNQLSPDMWAASALLEQEGFRLDSGNKSATGWFLTGHDTNQRRGSVKLQSNGNKIVLTVTG
jgi:hypothetical protein